jgi:hypothetical protein
MNRTVILLALGLICVALSVGFATLDDSVTTVNYISETHTEFTVNQNAFAKYGSFASALIAAACFISAIVLSVKVPNHQEQKGAGITPEPLF